MKQLFQQALSSGSLAYQLEKGQWGLFQLRAEGIASSGQSVNLTDLGNVIVRWNGQDIVNVDFEFLNLFGNLYGGVCEYTSINGGAFKISAFIFTGLPFDPQNVFDVDENDKVEIVWTWYTTKIVSGYAYVFGKPRSGIMSYVPGLYIKSVVSSGAGVINDNIPVENIATLFIKNPSALISRLQVARDGKVIVDGATGAIQAYSDWIHLLETTNNLLAIEFVESKNVKDVISTQLSYSFTTTGSGIIQLYYARLIPKPEKVEISMARSGL